MSNESDFVISYGCLTKYKGEGGSVVIPETVTNIQWSAFEGCTSLTSVVIPGSISAISGNCFKNCSSLTSVTIPESVKEIGFNAFANCTSLTEIRIPDSVKKIAGYAFMGCSSLKSITLPEGLSELDRGLFYGCSNLESVTIPESVTKIDWNVFENCSSLRDVMIPESVKSIGSQAFKGCGALADENGFIVVKGTLYDYLGPGGDVVIPDGVTRLDREVFLERDLSGETHYREGDDRITGLVIPEGVTYIGNGEFTGCSALKRLSLPKSLKYIGDYAFSTVFSDSSWPLRELQLPQGCEIEKDAFDYVVKKVLRLNADFFAVPEKLPAHYAEFFTMAEPEPHAVAMCRLYQTGKTWQKPLEDAIAAVDQDALVSELVGITAERKEETAASTLVAFALDYLDRLSFNQMQRIYSVLKTNSFKALKKLALNDDFQTKWLENLSEAPVEELPLSPIEQLVKDNWKITAQTKKLKNIIKEGIKFRDSDEISSPEAVIFIINEYASQLEIPTYLSLYETDYVGCLFSENADKVAAALEHEPLQTLLEEIAYKEEYNKDGFLLALGRYGSGKQISHLIAQMKDWETWYKYAATGRRNIIIARGALMMSDTREAMLELDKVGALGVYAGLRGQDEDTLRDTVLSDFGFDEEGKKYYSLGAGTLQVSMDRDLKLTLFDCSTGKAVKSVPKKNADPILYETAKADIAELKKNIKRVVKSRSQKLFNAFLTGRGQNPEAWKTSYLGNPVLKAVAELLVWQQGEKTFAISPDGMTDSFGQLFALGSEDVCVAYPSEMNPEELQRWQSLFLAEKRKQPFEQIWEPVINPASVKADRYMGCKLNVYKFSGKERHGISTYGMGDYSEDYGFTLTDCKLEAEASEWRFVHGVTDDAYYTLGEFTLEKYSRVSNHIMGLLDRWTVSERVLKDEQDITQALESFTLAQIVELIDLASNNNCTNSLAVLMAYKNKRFPEADPLAEFTLE